MTTTIISNMPPYSFGQQTNQAVGKLISLQGQLLRLGEAVATASSGYTGVEGTEFETSTQNLFGIVPSETPGEQGKAYRYAMDSLVNAWKTFWTTASPFLEQLDNGQNTM